MDADRTELYAYVVVAMILAVFAIIATEAMDALRFSRLINDAKDQIVLFTQRQDDFAEDVKRGHEELARMEERAAAAAAMKTEWEKTLRRMQEIGENLPRVKAESARLRDAVNGELARLRVVRASDYFPSFALANGRVFHSVKFHKIVPEGLKIQHRDGMTTVGRRSCRSTTAGSGGLMCLFRWRRICAARPRGLKIRPPPWKTRPRDEGGLSLRRPSGAAPAVLAGRLRRRAGRSWHRPGSRLPRRRPCRGRPSCSGGRPFPEPRCACTPGCGAGRPG